MKKTLLALAAVAALSAVPCAAQTQAPAPAPAPAAAPAAAEPPASPLSFNVGVVSDYRFRGISQTRFGPALQGGVDYSLPYGFYIGAWASTIRWIKDAGEIAHVDVGSGPVEIDFYGGYKGEIVKDTLSYDVGLLQYYYPSQDLSKIPNVYDPNTLEIYGALTYGPATIKYSHSLTRLFGTQSSKGSGYIEAAATFDVGGGFTVTPHIGYQNVRNNSSLSYTDWSLAAAKDWYGFTFTLAYVGADTKDVNGASPYLSPTNKNLGRSTLVLGVKKVF